jgi:hypothetical protein
MIESLAEHGVLADDLVPALMTTHTVANPEYDPAAARKKDEDNAVAAMDDSEDITSTSTGSTADAAPSTIPATPSTSQGFQTTIRVLEETKTAVPGVSTTLSNTDENVTLDIRWTVLCDLFLILVADSVYDARSRVLLEHVALKLGLGWLDVTRFERRVTDALEMQENIERLDQKDIVEGRQQSSKKRRYVMMGLATLGEPYMLKVCFTPVDSNSTLGQAEGSSSASLRVCWHRLLELVSVQLWRRLVSPAQVHSSEEREERPSSRLVVSSRDPALLVVVWLDERNWSRRLNFYLCTTTSV